MEQSSKRFDPLEAGNSRLGKKSSKYQGTLKTLKMRSRSPWPAERAAGTGQEEGLARRIDWPGGRTGQEEGLVLRTAKLSVES